MSLSSSCKEFSISKSGVLSAKCKIRDTNNFSSSSIKLDDYVGFIDGKLTWGSHGFSAAAESLSVNAEGILTARSKGGSDKATESHLDLNRHIKNVDGSLELITRPLSLSSPKRPEPIKLVAGQDVAKAMLSANSASTATTASSSNMFSAASTMSSATTVSTSSTMTSKSSYFASSSFRRESHHLLIEETCTKLELKGTFLHAQCRRLDGAVVHSKIDLDTIIGFLDGHLQWDISGFSTHCFEYSLDGFFLVAKYRIHKGDEYRIARLDLRTRLRNSNGVLIIIELNKKLSLMLSEVPWMKFKVIAEPDLSVFAKHPVMQETLVSIAETTVEHVTIEMHKMLTIAMETAITAITASAMKHVSAQMESLVTGAVGHASASASITAAENLHIYGGGYYGRGSAYIRGAAGVIHDIHQHREIPVGNGASTGHAHSPLNGHMNGHSHTH
ncbi:hypothetical protein JR316_0005891 [Psilocybe cubensis]|uniref:Cyanovirin-N domain-containing protein n=2 Tax=Psilocybe cubensis TaxID=181762 RepID=A0A8H7Y0D4_PSICU|nr:hypothetical protein JR316_0005891 [Psilocybe cubensis]KAH9481366.1 hypothetical protein JR316_0005891 [Psilocybe cubensis]